MELKTFLKGKYKILAVIMIISIALSLICYNELGAKDTAVFFLATVLLLSEICLIFVNKKKALLLFILSLPIIVTARKVCYFDLLFIRITYETIFVTLFFIVNIKSVFLKIKYMLSNEKDRSFKFVMYLGIFILFALISCIFSNDAIHSASEVYISIIVPCFFMFDVIITFNRNDMSKIIYSLIIGIDFSCIYGFSQVVMNHIPLKSISSNRDLVTFGYHNINIFASILMAIMPFLLQQILYVKNTKKNKIFLYTSFAINMLALFLTYTRGAWITFILVSFVILISKKYRKIVYVFLAIGLVVVKPVFSYILSRGTSTNIYADESVMARIQSIFTSIKMITLYPFGIGPDNFAVMFKKYLSAGYMLMPEKLRWKMNVANYTLESAHNLWLQIGVEYGLVCVIVFAIIIINRLVVAFKHYVDNRASIISIGTFLIFSVLTGVEFNHKGVITSTLVLWLVFGLIQINNDQNNLINKKH